MNTFIYRTRIEISAEDVFAWHERPGAFERLRPPWERVRVLERSGGIRDGARMTLDIPFGPFRRRWILERRDYEKGRSFRDVQIDGPFAHWDHLYLFEPDGSSACFLEDRIEYALPFGALGKIVGEQLAQKKLRRLFGYRHAVAAGDLEFHSRHLRRSLKILVTGASGLIGSQLVPFLTAAGHDVFMLTRAPSSENNRCIHWNPAAGELDLSRLEGFDAVIHLAGENIAGRWTPEKKRRIRDSRVEGTRFLCQSLARLPNPPKVLVCASAIGYYGDCGEEAVDETSSQGEGFLAQVVGEWEEAAAAARSAGMRTVHLRFGVVLTPAGGALAPMLTPFRLGLGGAIGDGRQYMSWIALDDALGVILHCLMTDSLAGPVNAVSPRPADNCEFVRTLGKVLHRPAILPLPAFAVRLLFGEMGEELLLSGVRAIPAQLQKSGFVFRHENLEAALCFLLGKKRGKGENDLRSTFFI
ncbi:MAG: TIGR01777 family oxidoreductase [Candidatus Omnitrophota bacterium]